MKNNMKKKQVIKILTCFIFAIMLSFVCIYNVNAASYPSTITIKNKPPGYKNTIAHHRITTTGYDAYCAQHDASGPGKGTVLTNPKEQTDGRFIYILNDTAISGDNGWPKSILIRQHAYWICQGATAAKKYVFHEKAEELCNAAKAAGKDFSLKPSITSVTNPGTLEIGDNNYYESKAISVKLKNVTDNKYKISFSNAPTGTKAYTTSGQEITGYTTASSFIVKVPVSSVTKETNFDITITANSSTYKRVVVYYHKKHQNLAVPYPVTETPSTKVTATVKPVGTTIKKVDIDTNKALGGAKYKIYKNSDCTEEVQYFTDTYTTNTSGIATITGLKSGTYYVKEIEPPAGYAAPSNSCLSVSAGGTVTFKNKKNSVKLYKQDQDHRNLEGATFGLYTNPECTTRAVNATTGKIFDFANTDSNGTVTFEGMKATTSYYYLKEETPPNGYYVLPDSENCKAVAVNGTVTFINQRVAISELAVQKRDYYTKFGINGVRIGLFTDPNCSNKITEAVTGSGQVKYKVEYVEGTVSSLYAREMETPDGYIPEKGKGNFDCKELKLGTTQNTAIIYNKPYGDIRLLKLDSETQKPIKGAEFALIDGSGNPVKDADGQEVQAKKTDAEGVIEFKNILYGTYFVKETASDGKHKIQTKTIKIELNSNNDAAKLKVNSNQSYVVGDANLDGQVTEDDLTVFQSIVNDPDLRYGLSPEALYALDINGDGNALTSDVRKDMKILEYYLRINSSQDAVAAAQRYEEYKQELCDAVGDDECDASNIRTILSMYNNNSSLLTEYQTAQNAANQEAETQNAHAREVYEQEMADYNTECPDGVNTMVDEDSGEGPVSLDGTTTSSNGMVPKAKCQEVPHMQTITPENVCPNYSYRIQGDINQDCKVNDSDVSAFDNSSVDLNGDGASNAVDKKILTNYISYLSNANAASIIQTMSNITTNQDTICEALGTEDCSIDSDLLADALAKVGRSATLPANVAKSSLVVVNQPIYLKISKQSITNSKEIPGAKIIIRDAKGNKVLEYTSTKKPKKFKIGIGRYTLTEKVAPKGYKTLTTVVTFEVLENGTTKLVGAASSYYKIKNSNHLIIYNELNDNVVIPDTGSNVAIVSVVLGVVLVVGGGFLIYKKMA